MATSPVNVESRRNLAVAVLALDLMAERSRAVSTQGAEFAHGTWHAQAPCSLHTGTKPADTGYANPIVHGIRQPRGTG